MALSVTLAGIAISPAAIAATVIGLAIGASAAGRMVDLYGGRPAFLVAFAGGSVPPLTVGAGRRYLGRKKASPTEPDSRGR